MNLTLRIVANVSLACIGLILAQAATVAQQRPVSEVVQMADALPAVPQASAPSSPTPNRWRWYLLSFDTGARLLDAYSTRRMLSQGNKEGFLPDAIAGHTGAMYAFSLGAAGINWEAGRILARRGHTRLARAIALLDAGGCLKAGIGNLGLGDARSRGTSNRWKFGEGATIRR